LGCKIMFKSGDFGFTPKQNKNAPLV